MRYLVVETGGFLHGRRVLVSPMFFRHADWATRHFHIGLSRDKIKASPDLDVDKPVSRQHEQDYYGYYGYPYYWGYSGLWGTGASPGLLAPDMESEQRAGPLASAGDAHLRSVKEIVGYDIQGSDGAIGHVADLIVDDETWEVRYLVVDTSHWWWGKKVLVAPHWASGVSWLDKRVSMSVSRAEVKASPAWDGTEAVNRKYEAELHDYYGRPVYWGGDPPAERGSHRDAKSGARP